MDAFKDAEKQIYEMNMLDMLSAKDLGVGVGWAVLRVPGGWVFSISNSSCFVPEPKMEVELMHITKGKALDDALKSRPPAKKTGKKPVRKKVAKTDNK